MSGKQDKPAEEKKGIFPLAGPLYLRQGNKMLLSGSIDKRNNKPACGRYPLNHLPCRPTMLRWLLFVIIFINPSSLTNFLKKM